MLEYKGYYGSVDYSKEDKVFFGKVEFIKGLISYEGTDVKSLNQAFEDAVNDYLETCKRQKLEPQKPFKGSFNVRVGTELHRKAMILAQKKDSKLNRIIVEALKQYLANQA
jgi:predicted HicB family RNase H-like nuclease